MRIIACAVRMLFALFSLFPQRDEVAFLSRQSERPFDFALLEPALLEALPGWRTVWLCRRDTGSLGAGIMLQQLWHAAIARVCVVDGYVPAVCITWKRRRAYVVQLWHALGAIKKFGYQALDTPDGRTSKVARGLCMHRGYDVVVAGLPGAADAYAQAFDCPRGTVKTLGLPRIDYLTAPGFAARRRARERRAEEAAGIKGALSRGAAVVLYAPTLRRGNREGGGWFAQAVSELGEARPQEGEIELLVSGHPLQDTTAEGTSDTGERQNLRAGNQSTSAVCGQGTARTGAQEGTETDGQHIASACGEPHGAAGTRNYAAQGTQNSISHVHHLHRYATRDAFGCASYVITDYSATAFEAALAGKKVLFYVPDIEEYRRSPGLNIDPELAWPELSFREARSLMSRIAQDMDQHDLRPFSVYARDYLGEQTGSCIEAIVQNILNGLKK